MRFDQKLMNYATMENLTERKLFNCRKLIENQFSNGATGLQIITLKSVLKVMKRRVEKNFSNLVESFNYYFNDILSMELK